MIHKFLVLTILSVVTGFAAPQSFGGSFGPTPLCLSANGKSFRYELRLEVSKLENLIGEKLEFPSNETIVAGLMHFNGLSRQEALNEEERLNKMQTNYTVSILQCEKGDRVQGSANLKTKGLKQQQLSKLLGLLPHFFTMTYIPNAPLNAGKTYSNKTGILYFSDLDQFLTIAQPHSSIVSLGLLDTLPATIIVGSDDGPVIQIDTKLSKLTTLNP